MSLNLIHLGQELSDDEFVKILLSSGDHFPGFYRFTLGDRNHEPGQLSPKGLFAAYMDEQCTGKQYTRGEWTKKAIERHESSMDPRSKTRSDHIVYELLADKYTTWMTSATTYDVALIEIDNVGTTLESNKTYFFMGCLIQFTQDEIKIGVDSLRGTSLMTFPINLTETMEYVMSLYGDNIKDLFLPADIVASLTFTDDIGSLHMTDNSLSQILYAHDNSIVIGSNRDVSHHIPIRWAKDIILTEVCNAAER